MMVRPDSTSIMMDFFLPSNLIMYKFITEESLIRLALSFFCERNEMGNNAKIFFGVGREPQSFVLLMMRDVVRQLLDNMHLL